MPFTDKELHPSITLGQENNRFPLFFEPQILLREASPPVNGSVPQGQKKLIDCYHLKPSSDYCERYVRVHITFLETDFLYNEHKYV